MNPQKSGKLTRTQAVESSNDSSTSTDENSNNELHNLGSRLKLIRDKRKNGKSAKRHRSVKLDTKSNVDEADNRIMQVATSESGKPPTAAKESSIAQSIKRKFGFFRRSESAKSVEDVEAAVAERDESLDAESQQTVDVVVDVHCENEKQNTRVIKKSVSSKSSDEQRKSDSENEIGESLDLIQEVHGEQSSEDKKRPERGFVSDVADSDLEHHSSLERVNDKSIEDLTSEILPTSGHESSRRRRRWDKSEISADDLVEDLKKPRRKQWAKGTSSAGIRKSSDRKSVVPRRSATAVPDKYVRSRSSSSKIPVAAPRSRNVQKESNLRGFSNDGYSSEHDEVLRIETVNNSSPKIKMGSTDKIENGASSLSEEEEKEIIDYQSESVETTENSDIRDRSATDTNDSSNLIGRKAISRRRSSSKRKFSVDTTSVNDDAEEDEVDEDEDEQETVLNVMDKKSRGSSSSSKIEIIPTNFFERKSSEETTISTNEDMHMSRKDSHLSRSRSKSKSSRQERSEDNVNLSGRSSRAKRKTTSSSTRNSTEEHSTARKVKSRTKKRHKKKEKKHLDDVEEEMKYIAVRIHRSDMLEADYITRHPMVKVYIVNADTGENLKIRNKDQIGGGSLQPIITGKFDFKEKQSMVPVWEEELIFEHDSKDLLVEGKGSVVILFEIVDLLTFTEASVCYDQFGRDACWYKVAWAYLRPVGATGVKHIDKKVRLQLYRPKKSFRKISKNKCEVYKWWKSNFRDKYPSSLYVSVTSVEPPKLEPFLYEQLLQLNELSDVLCESQYVSSPRTVEEPGELPKWTRLTAQSCQIPNDVYLETEASENGCFYVAFSNDGKYLACAVSEEYDYPILVYKLDDGKIHVRFSGHKNFIYSLSWSHDDRYLLSVSSDQTARFWDTREKIIEHVQSLPHPSYVYSGKFSGNSTGHIVTGCYDHVARIWARLHHNDSHQYELVQELEAHESFVNAVSLQTKDDTCLTGDGVGVIIVWTVKKSRRSPIKKEWQIARKIKIKELEGVPINTLAMHPTGSKMLVHSRNNGLRLIDMVTGVVGRKFEGLKNFRIQVTACISPCGGLLFCGGEDSTLNVWSLDSGKLLAVYQVDSHDKAVTCVDYHPYDHVLAFAVYGVPLPVKILKFDREATGKNVGLKLMSTAISTSSISSTIRLKEQPTILANGVKHLEKLSTRSLNSSVNFSQSSQILVERKGNDETRGDFRGKLQKFIESGPNIKAKSMNRLSGIIEKIDRILMYATSQKSPALELESMRNAPVFAIEQVRIHGETQFFELKDLSIPTKPGRKLKSHRQRSRSARNACSPIAKETELFKAFSDSAAFNGKISRFSDDSSISNRSMAIDNVVVDRLAIEKIDYLDTESGFKDSLDTIIDGKEDFPSEEILDVESLRSDDTYVLDKDKKSPTSVENDNSEKSNATFVIENEIPIPKPRRRIGRIEVM